MSRISVVVVNFRTEDFLRPCLESLRGSTSLDLEVIVVDNSRGGGAKDVLSACCPGAKLIENSRNVGYARAVNQGLAASDSEFVFVVNPDTVTDPGALDRLLELARSLPEAGIVAPKLLNPDGTVQMSCRRFYTLKTIILRRTFLGRVFKDSPSVRRHLMLDWDHDSTAEVDWVIGAAMFVRRAAIAEVGPMDERFFLYFEDVDWCYRMQAAGWKVYYCPEAKLVHHYRRQSAQARFGRAKRAHLESWLRFSEKWSLVLYLLKRNRDSVSRVVLVAADVAALCSAFYLAYAARANLGSVLAKPTPSFQVYGSFMALAVVVGVAALGYVGLYGRQKAEDTVDLLFDVTRAMVLTSVVLMASTFLLYVKIYSRAMVLMFLPVSMVVLTLERSAFRHAQRRLALTRVNARRVLVLGSGEMAERAREAVRRGAHEGLELAGFMDTAGVIQPEPAGQRGLAAAPAEAGVGAAKILRLAHAQRAGEIVLADTPARIRAMWPVVSELSGRGFQVAVASELGELLTEGDKVEERGGFSFVSLRKRTRPGGPVKAATEFVLALLGLIVYAVPVAVAYAALAAAGRRPAMQKEHVRSASGRKATVRHLNCGGAGTGGLLGKSGVCWAPALAAVLSGKVALVGVMPRPYEPGRPPEGGLQAGTGSETVQSGGKEEAGGAKPGLFGLWKLAAGPEEAAHKDNEYLADWSFSLDLKTFIRCVLRRE
ncbi:MAG: glycosyltransferase [Candidatus Eisenbacteria bacterium]|nr:glycosyltransferase [Candidatus Eisenbacteria bacterium]